MRFPAIVTVLVTYPDNRALIMGLYEHAVASTARFETIRKFIHVFRALCWVSATQFSHWWYGEWLFLIFFLYVFFMQPNTAPVPEVRDHALHYKKVLQLLYVQSYNAFPLVFH